MQSAAHRGSLAEWRIPPSRCRAQAIRVIQHYRVAKSRSELAAAVQDEAAVFSIPESRDEAVSYCAAHISRFGLFSLDRSIIARFLRLRASFMLCLRLQTSMMRSIAVVLQVNVSVSALLSQIKGLSGAKKARKVSGSPNGCRVAQASLLL